MTWEGLFTFKPNADQVAKAIYADIAKLDIDVDDAAEYADDLRTTLELVTFQKPELLGDVRIGGTCVGEISMEVIEAFGMVEEAMMPRINLPRINPPSTLYDNLCGVYDGVLTDPRTGGALVHPVRGSE
jgi:hypothetical protein